MPVAVRPHADAARPIPVHDAAQVRGDGAAHDLQLHRLCCLCRRLEAAPPRRLYDLLEDVGRHVRRGALPLPVRGPHQAVTSREGGDQEEEEEVRGVT